LLALGGSERRASHHLASCSTVGGLIRPIGQVS
jgi:hypothetical protein